MDRRTWMQLVTILAAAREAQPQQRGGTTDAGGRGGGRGRGGLQDQPMRVTKDQVAAALKLLGLEFQDAEIDMMMRGVNQALYSYESLRKADVPLDTEPAFSFRPGLPDRTPIKGPQRFETNLPRSVTKPANLEDVAFWRVVDLAPVVKSRAVSSTDLTKMYIERMKKYSPKLLCLITLTEELAMEQAAAADKEIRAGRYRGPLHGIPFGLKDLFDTKGILTTFGAEPYQTRIPDKDATVVERLRAAGAVLIAKLSMGALAQGGLWFKGMTKTPWNIEATSSGSSAGSASATAAGLVGFSLGTETLGSIVSPSQACGTVGLRPTYGRISRYGAMGLSWTMDKIGPICRGVEDCALVLNACYGPDGKDRTVGADPFHWEPRKPLAAMKIGILQRDFDRYTGDQKKVYDQALADLKRAGVNATPTEFAEDGPTIRFLLSAEAAAAFDDITRDGQVRNLRGQAPNDWPNSFRTSRLIPAVEYVRAQRARTLLIQKFERFMSEWDAIVMPPNSLLTTTNLTGNPQVVMKCGFTEATRADGVKVQVPRSISFLGKIYDEGSPLRVALAYESVTDWHRKNPTLEA
ncbi:MAG TPA: amidase [Verrucomicrobiae bacterium]|nr:amidase [Verrucomicrobiae bacterium]